jgi:hypothetical protein
MTLCENGEVLFSVKEVKQWTFKGFLQGAFYGFLGGFIFAYMIFSILH